MKYLHDEWNPDDADEMAINEMFDRMERMENLSRVDDLEQMIILDDLELAELERGI